MSEDNLAFGVVPVNSKSTKALTLTCVGADDLTINSVGIAGSGFSISEAAFPTTLAQGQSVTLQVTFSPSAAGVASGAITVISTASSRGETTVSLSGTGNVASTPQLTANTNSLAFGNVTLNTASTKSLTLISSGTAPVAISSVTTSGKSFELSGATFPATLKSGDSMTLEVRFDPLVAGDAVGSIAIASNSTSGEKSAISLSGTGIEGVTPQLTVSANSLDFGDVVLNTTSAKALTLTSSGTVPLTVNSVTESGAGFSISGSAFPVTLSPGQSQTVQVHFEPARSGAASGTIAFSSNATSDATTVTLSGAGTLPQLTVSSTSLAFGNVALKSTSTKPLTLTSSGTAPLTVNSVMVAGSRFSIAGHGFPTTLNPGQSATLQVSFDPGVTGTATGILTISSNASVDGTVTVNLSGTGINPTNAVLSLSAAKLAFGDDPVGTAMTLPLTLTSTGSSPVTVSSASVTGAEFTISGATFPVTLNPGIAITIRVQFNPSGVGSAYGELIFISNSSTGNRSVVNLTGTATAIQHQVTLTWMAPANSPVPVIGYNVHRAAITGTSFQILNSSSIAHTAFVDTNVITHSTYTYFVTSVDAAGTESVPSNEVIVTIP